MSEHPTNEIVKAVQKWVSKFDPNNANEAHHMLEGLWVLQAHNVQDDKLMGMLQTSSDLNVRRAALTVQHYQYNVDFTRGGDEWLSQRRKVPEPRVVVNGDMTLLISLPYLTN